MCFNSISVAYQKFYLRHFTNIFEFMLAVQIFIVILMIEFTQRKCKKNQCYCFQRYIYVL